MADRLRPQTSKTLVARRFQPVFRDRTDLSVGGALGTRIEAALTQSERLIVICSAAAANSEWVNREVAIFLARNPVDHVFPVIHPSAGDVSDVEQELYPPALRGHQLLAADLRNVRHADGRVVGDGLVVGRLKLMAGFLGTTLDELLRRERKRQRFAAAALTGVVLVLGALAAVAGIQTMAERAQRELALTKTQEAESNASEAARQSDRAQENERRALLNEAEARTQAELAIQNAARADRAAAQATAELAARNFDAENWFDAVLASLTWSKQSPQFAHLGFLRWAADGLVGLEYLPVQGLEAASAAPDRPAFYFAADGTIYHFDIATRTITLRVRTGQAVFSLAAGSRQVLAQLADGQIQSFRTSDFKKTAEVSDEEMLQRIGWGFALTPDGRYVVSCSLDELEVFDAATLTPVKSFDISDNLDTPRSCGLLSGSLVYASGQRHQLVVDLNSMSVESLKAPIQPDRDLKGKWYEYFEDDEDLDSEAYFLPSGWPLYFDDEEESLPDGGPHLGCPFASADFIDWNGVRYPQAWMPLDDEEGPPLEPPASSVLWREEFYPINAAAHFFGRLAFDRDGMWYARADNDSLANCEQTAEYSHHDWNFDATELDVQRLAESAGLPPEDFVDSIKDSASGLIGLFGKRVVILNPKTNELQVDFTPAVSPDYVSWTPDFRLIFLRSEQTQIWDGVLQAYVGLVSDPFGKIVDVSKANGTISSTIEGDQYQREERAAPELFADLFTVRRKLCGSLMANLASYQRDQKAKVLFACAEAQD